MSEIRAMETIYKGFRFRSRLEARWAMFFDRVGIPWDFEPQPLIVDGEAYLPDFKIHVDGHEFIHEVKRESDESIIQPRTVYLAGKVSPQFEWRGDAAVTDRHSRLGVSDHDLSEDPYSFWYKARRLVTMNGARFLLTGPFPSSCDHGCAHAPESRHMAETCNDDGSDGQDIVKACTGTISQSDMMCAHIETGDAYGTLVEIGYAVANQAFNRKIHISLTMDGCLQETHPRGSDSHDRCNSTEKSDLWFVHAMVSAYPYGQAAFVSGRDEARSVHAKFIQNHTDRAYRLISALGEKSRAFMTFGDPLHVAKTGAGHWFGSELLTSVFRRNISHAEAIRAHRFDNR